MASAALLGLLAQMQDATGTLWNEETYDLAIARTLDPQERDTFAKALADAIDRGDARAALTAGSLGLDSCIPALRRQMHHPDSFGLGVRRALTTLGQGASVVDLLVKDLQAPGKIHRFAAAMALGRAGRPRSVPATEGLISALADPEDLVRTRAFESLLEVLDLGRYAQNAAGDDVELRSPLRRLDLLLGSTLQSLREPARRELESIARGILAGDTPEQLELAYAPQTADDFRLRLGRSLFDPDAPMPLDEVLALAPDSADRRWAEALIAKALERKVLRAPGALATLHAQWTVPALREASDELESDDPFHVEAQKAIERLESAPN